MSAMTLITRKTKMAKQLFKVMVISRDSRNVNADGITSNIIENECGHNHSTLSGAYRCYRNLTKQFADGMYSAAWYHSEIRHEDATMLTEAEVDIINELELAEEMAKYQ